MYQIGISGVQLANNTGGKVFHIDLYCPYWVVRTGTRTARYRAVPPKSTVGGRLREKKRRIRRRGKEERRRRRGEEEFLAREPSLPARSIEGEKEKKKKKRKRRKKKKKRRRIPHAVLAREPSLPAGRLWAIFLSRREKDRGDSLGFIIFWLHIQENVNKSWLIRNAESLDLEVEESASEEDVVKGYKQKKISSLQLKKLQQELNDHLKQPLQPKTFSHRFLAGVIIVFGFYQAGVSPLLQQQLEQLSKMNTVNAKNSSKRAGFVVIGQDLVEPLQALRSSGHEV
ncbi:hypothetical protein BHM03_00007189 [Ensete ventricosum]|nr:hypothetical protein BHM03_00007189 [Ensete ventricosum]